MKIFRGIKQLKWLTGENKPTAPPNYIAFIKEVDDNGEKISSEIYFNGEVYGNHKDVSNEWFGTAIEYEAIPTKDNNTIYYIYE